MEPTKYLTVRRFPARLVEALNTEAARRGITAAELVRIAVSRELDVPVEILPGVGEDGATAPLLRGGVAAKRPRSGAKIAEEG